MSETTHILPRTQALILAGGQGERLYPLTLSRPKPAVPFGGAFRIIDFTLWNCLKSGLDRVSVLTQHRREQLHAYIRDAWGEMWRTTSLGRTPLLCLPPTNGKRYRGTADAVFQNMGVLASEKPDFVLILAGDHVYDMDYRDIIQHHAETNADLTLATVEHPLEDASHFGVVEVDREFKVIGFQEKPREPRTLPWRPAMALVSMGVYVFKTAVLARALLEHCDTGRGYDFGHDMIPSLVRSGRSYAYDFRDEAQDSPRYWRDIGTLDSYYESSMDLVGPHAALKPHLNDCWHLPTALARTVRTRVSSNARVSQSVLSDGVRIEEGAWVEDSVLMPGVSVGKGARIRHAIVQDGVHIPAGLEVGVDLEGDRNHYLVTDAGVVIVSGGLQQKGLVSRDRVNRFRVRWDSENAVKPAVA